MGILFAKKTPQAQQPIAANGLQIQTSVFGKAIAIRYGQSRGPANIIWYGDFQSIAVQNGGNGGGGGKGSTGSGGSKGGGGGSITYNYQTSMELALCEGQIDGIGKVWGNTSKFSDANAAGFSVLVGSYSQSPWAYLVSAHPSEALAYRGLAMVVASNLQLGGTPQVPQYSWEIFGLYRFSPVDGIYDANPAAFIPDILTNANYGAGLSASQVNNLAVGNTSFSNFCIANGIFLSPSIDSQEDMATLLTRWCALTISDAIWHEGAVSIIPYSTENASGNSTLFTPNLTPLYDLTDDDFLGDEQAPVQRTRTNPADAYNALTIEYLDRANDYNMATVEWRDQGAVDTYGYRPAPSVFQAHEICVTSVAGLVAQLMGQRGLYIRNKYSFKLPINFCLLEPMDLVTLTDANLGLNRQLVRITNIDEAEDIDGTMAIIAEEVLIGIAAPALYGAVGGTGYSPDFNAAPPDTNAPIIFAPPIEIAISTLELWLAASGVAGWGGCEVWVSSDGNTYAKQGVIHARARMGILRAALPSGTDPDNFNACKVDLTTSLGTLISGTQADADLAHTLCYVDGELISYQTAALFALNKYDLTYLRRGLYGSPIGAHDNGSDFTRLDEAIFDIPYTADQIGSTIYIKLPSFNGFGGALQSLADVNATAFIIPAPPPPSNVTGFAVAQNGGSVVFKWNQVVDYALKGYDIGYAALGETDWSKFQLLTEAAKGTEMTNAGVPPGTWTFGIRARDIAEQLSPIPTFADLTVVNEDDIISEIQQEPDWLGLQATQPSYFAIAGLSGLGNYVSTPDSAAISFTNQDLEIVAQINIAPIGINSIICSKSPGTLLDDYTFYIDSSGQLNLLGLVGGVSENRNSTVALASIGLTNVNIGTVGSPKYVANQKYWVRVKKTRSTGIIQFFYSLSTASDIPAVWTQFGTNVAGTAADWTNGSTALYLGRDGSVDSLSSRAFGNFYRVQIYKSAALVADFNPQDSQFGTPTSWASRSTGETWSIAQAGSSPGELQNVVTFVRHYTGILIPLGTRDVGDYVSLSAPAAPTLGSAAGGTANAATYYVNVTYTTTGGETVPSGETSGNVAANSVLTVISPLIVAGASAYNVYAWTSTGNEKLQNASPIALGTDWVAPLTGLVAGAAPPTQNTTGFEPFNVFVPDPVALATYESPVIDTGYDADLRVFATEAASMGYGQTGQPVLGLEIDTWLTAEGDLREFTPWTIGTLLMRYLIARLTLMITPGSVPYVTDFTPTVDTAPVLASSDGNMIVAPGGTTVIWDPRFHSPPNVQATVIGSTALFATCSAVSSTQGTFHVFNNSGSDVGGTISWTAEGE